MGVDPTTHTWDNMAIPKDAMKFDVVVERVVERHLNEEKLKQALTYIGAAAKRNKTYNFDVSIPRSKIVIQPVDDGSGIPKYRYTAQMTVWKENFRSAGAVREQWEAVKSVMAKASSRMKWRILDEGAPSPTVPAEAVEPTKVPKKIVSRTDVVLPPLTPDVYATYFHRLYNREPQIRIIYDSANLAVRTGFKERNHVLLRGQAGTAKTDLFTSFCDFIGTNKVWHVDATTLTKAGLERELIQRSKDGVLQPFILVEEIEKVTSPENINCLLQVMDTRGRIQRTNARDGDVYEECKVVVWATCNDSEYLRTFADGAIWSRFSLRPICKRPDADLMRKILIRSVREMEGNEKWVEPVIRFMWDELKQIREYKNDYNDPRLGRALLAGGDRLFDRGPEGFFSDFLACCEGKETGEEVRKGDANA